jgi:hypothetical protein
MARIANGVCLVSSWLFVRVVLLSQSLELSSNAFHLHGKFAQLTAHFLVFLTKLPQGPTKFGLKLI